MKRQSYSVKSDISKAVIVILLMLSCSGSAVDKKPEDGIAYKLSFGGSAGYVIDNENKCAFGIEATILFPYHISLSIGGNVDTVGERTLLRPYLELGTLIMYLSTGVGIAFDANDSEHKTYFQLFFGIPFPVMSTDDSFIYVEPYYRPRFDAKQHNNIHEIGIFVKYLL